MRNYIIYILLFTFMVSCKNSVTSCINANLNKTITILGFPKTENITSFKTSIYEITKDSTLRKMGIKKIFFSNDKYNYLNIELDEDLFANNSYQLNLNDSIKYRISEIETFSEIRMIGNREDSVCKTKSFKVNNKMAEVFFTTGINFKKP